MQFSLFLIPALLLISCTTPDLSDTNTFSVAKKKAIELNSLERKFMYGMFHLYVSKNGDPFTGWVKTTRSGNQLTELGYLKNGRKEGLWLSWGDHANKLSEVYWSEDRLEGPFTIWHPNGNLKVNGQTKDGEIDGEWTEYYATGQLACRSTNRIGHLVEISVWKPDGTICTQSSVIEGNGSFSRYLEDGRVEYTRTFKRGVETSRKEINQR